MLEILIALNLFLSDPKIALDTYFPQEIKQPIVTEEKKEKEYTTQLMRVTAYAPHDNKSGICNDGSANSTSTGIVPETGTAAVDPDKIPYGTKLYIDGYGYATAEDTGGALRRYNGYAIDLYFRTYEEAIQWGVRYIEVKIYKGE